MAPADIQVPRMGACLPLLPVPIISVNDFPRVGGGQQPSSVKSQIVNIFSFVNHVLSALTTQFCNCRDPAAVENMESKEHSCVQIKLYLQKQMTGCIRPMSCSLPTSVPEQSLCGLAHGKHSMVSRQVDSGPRRLSFLSRHHFPPSPSP